MEIKISEKYKIDLETLKTSTSGALGQPQFLPSTFLNDGVDLDNDGLANIWDSEADTLASICNFRVECLIQPFLFKVNKENMY